MKRNGNPREYNRNRYFQRDQRNHQDYYYHEHQRQERIDRQRQEQQHRFMRERERPFPQFHQFNQFNNQFNHGMRNYRPPQKERRSVLLPVKKEEKPPEKKESSSEEDIDQDFIEESIDKIDTEMDKQERLLAAIRAKMSSIKEKEEEPRIVIGDQKAIMPTLVGIRSSKMRHGVGYTTSVESIYDENRRLIKAVNKKHDAYSSVLSTATYDPRLWTRLEKIDIQKRPAIVAFVRAHVLATNREQQKLLIKYEDIEERYQESHEFVVEEEEIVFEEDFRKRKGRGDSVRSDLEFEKTIAMLSKSDPLLGNYGHPAHSTQRENLINEGRFNPMGLANVPPMVSRAAIEKMTTYINNNDMVVDAKQDLSQYNSRMSWGETERQCFRSLLVQYGKDFHKIGRSMKKSTDEIVQYYYVEKVHSRFKNLLKRGGRGRKLPIDESEFRTYYLQSDEEFVHPWQTQDSGDESSECTKQEDNGWTAEEKQRAIRGFELFGRDFASVASLLPSKTPADCKQFFNNIRRSNDIEEEKDKKKRKKNPVEDDHEIKRPKPESGVSSMILQQVASASSKDKRSISYWSPKERVDFLEQLEKNGRNWDAIAHSVQTKSAIQVRNYFHNGRRKLGLDAVLEKYQQRVRQDKFKDLLNPTSPSLVVNDIQPVENPQYVPAGIQQYPKIRFVVRDEPMEIVTTHGILEEEAEKVVNDITNDAQKRSDEHRVSTGLTISDIINEPNNSPDISKSYYDSHFIPNDGSEYAPFVYDQSKKLDDEYYNTDGQLDYSASEVMVDKFESDYANNQSDYIGSEDGAPIDKIMNSEPEFSNSNQRYIQHDDLGDESMDIDLPDTFDNSADIGIVSNQTIDNNNNDFEILVQENSELHHQVDTMDSNFETEQTDDIVQFAEESHLINEIHSEPVGLGFTSVTVDINSLNADSILQTIEPDTVPHSPEEKLNIDSHVEFRSQEIEPPSENETEIVAENNQEVHNSQDEENTLSSTVDNKEIQNVNPVIEELESQPVENLNELNSMINETDIALVDPTVELDTMINAEDKSVPPADVVFGNSVELETSINEAENSAIDLPPVEHENSLELDKIAVGSVVEVEQAAQTENVLESGDILASTDDADKMDIDN